MTLPTSDLQQIASGLLHAHGDWQQRLAFVTDMMRDLSRQADPQDMVANYGQRMRKIIASDASMSLSRRDLEEPYFRITRSSRWDQGVNPWKNPNRLPVFKGGLLARLMWGDEPVIIDELSSALADDDPAIEYLAGFRSLVFVPLYDKGVALNAVVLLKNEPGAFPRERFAEHVWMSNLFGRATHSLVLADQVKRAYDQLDRELQVVADIQRSLLPTELPDIPGLEFARHYQTSTRAGGDYYDFFPLPDGQWGILIADVSGHGTPAAVIMAVTHSIAHMARGPACPPSRMMAFVNQHLTARYTGGSGTFVTAFYGIYDPAARTLSYSSAGHPLPRVIRNGRIVPLGGERSLPLGIDEAEEFHHASFTLRPGDTFVLYTDGITEARDPAGDMFGEHRLDCAACCHPGAADTLRAILESLETFRAGRPLADDRTLVVGHVVQTPHDDKGGGI